MKRHKFDFLNTVSFVIFAAIPIFPAHGSQLVFTSPSASVVISYGGLSTLDATGLVLTDTVEGIRVSGSFHGTIGDLGIPSAGYIQINTTRNFETDDGNRVRIFVHLSGDGQASGDVEITSYAASATLQPSPSGLPPCSTNINIESATLPSNFENQKTCITSGDPVNSIDLAFSMGFFSTGPGTVTLILGNSFRGEVTLAPSDVPEPSAMWLFGTGLLLFGAVKRSR